MMLSVAALVCPAERFLLTPAVLPAQRCQPHMVMVELELPSLTIIPQPIWGSCPQALRTQACSCPAVASTQASLHSDPRAVL